MYAVDLLHTVNLLRNANLLPLGTTVKFLVQDKVSRRNGNLLIEGFHSKSDFSSSKLRFLAVPRGCLELLPLGIRGCVALA